MHHTDSYNVLITPLVNKQLSGTIQAAASKSSMQRACAAALVARTKSIIRNPGHSNDDKAALDIIQRLGAIIDYDNHAININSSIVDFISANHGAGEGIAINCGESGLSIRMFTPIAALSCQPVTINGTGSLVTRPMDFFDEILPQLDVRIQSNKGKLPLVIRGPMIPKNIEIDGSLSSQFLTGLLMAYAASNASEVSIKVNNLKSKPYIDLTLDVMRQFALKVPENINYSEFYFSKATSDLRLPTSPSAKATENKPDYTVEGDWSGGAFLLVAGAIAGPIIVNGLDIHSTQADKAIVQALDAAGADLVIGPNRIEIGLKPMKAFRFNATDCPDLFPPLVALAAYCDGQTIIEGVSRLAHKESNRGIALQEEFGKMGIRIELKEDLMVIQGGQDVQGAQTHSHHDHRIAMACAVAGLKANGKSIIMEAGAVNKSYPDFYEHLRLLGADIEKDAYIYDKR